MTVDERIEAIARNLDTLTKIHLDNDREYRDRFAQLTAAIEKLQISVEKMQISVQQDAENIRGLARIAEIHERRLTDLEGGEQ